MTGPAHSVAAVVPALDEATAIGPLVGGLLRSGACCVFVVDGGSADGTADVARTAGAVVVDERRRGYGRACLSGAERAVVEHEIVAFLDGDGSCDPADLGVLIGGLADADVVLGARSGPTIEPGALPWHARAGNAFVAAILRRRTGRPVRDLPPFKVLRRSALRTLDLDDPGFGWTVQLVARALRAPGMRVVERPAAFRCRRGGRSKVSGSVRASFAAGRRMIAGAIAETRRRPVIALMAKAPRAGHAKTRLAADIGEAAALEFWSACLADLGPAVRAAARGVADTVAVVPADEDAGPVAELLGPGWSTIVQGRPGLGGAIAEAFTFARTRGADRAIAVSGDNPTLPPALLRAALDTLTRCPAVLGPSPDGGYHLVGVRLPRQRLAGVGRLGRLVRLVRPGRPGGAGIGPRLAAAFGAARLGGETALASTTRELAAADLRPCLTEPWPDVDTGADLAALVAGFHGVGGDTPRTRAWLARHAALLPTGEPVPARRAIRSTGG